MNELSNSQRKLLKYIISHPNCLSCNLEKEFKLSYSYLKENLTVLGKSNYIEISNYNGFIFPTIYGKNYFEMETKNSFKIVITSIFCPVIVAFITTLITLWLRG